MRMEDEIIRRAGDHLTRCASLEQSLDLSHEIVAAALVEPLPWETQTQLWHPLGRPTVRPPASPTGY